MTSDKFSVDPKTGTISTTSADLDYEGQKVYMLGIQVTDSGNPRQTAQLQVKVKSRC